MTRLTREQVRQADRRAIEQYHIPGIVLMEHASVTVAEIAKVLLTQAGGKRNKVLILCGGGNNGGDGLAASRHLHNCGCDVLIGLCTDPMRYKGDALINWQIVQAMKLPCFPASAQWISLTDADLIIDAIFGTGLDQEPRPPFAEIAEAVNKRSQSVLAVDVPSGLDCDTGLPLGACIRARWTVTFAAEKIGFANPAAKAFTGDVFVADIAYPRELIDELERGAGDRPMPTD